MLTNLFLNHTDQIEQMLDSFGNSSQLKASFQQRNRRRVKSPLKFTPQRYQIPSNKESKTFSINKAMSFPTNKLIKVKKLFQKLNFSYELELNFFFTRKDGKPGKLTQSSGEVCTTHQEQ